MGALGGKISRVVHEGDSLTVPQEHYGTVSKDSETRRMESDE